MLPPLERLEQPAARALRLLKKIASGWLGSGEDLHLEHFGPRMAASLSRALSPLFGQELTDGTWQAEAARSVVRSGGRRVEGAVGAMRVWLDVPARYQNLARGPRAYPVLNWMDSVLAELTRSRFTPAQFTEVIDALWDGLTEANRWLQEDNHTRGLAGCREALAGLQQLEDYARDSNPDLLEEGYNRFLEGYAILDQVYLEAAAQELGLAPTPCPQINWLIRAVEASDRGALEPEVLLRAADESLTLLSRTFYGLELQLTAFYGGPPALLKQVEEARGALDRLTGELLSQRLDPDVLQSAGHMLGAAQHHFSEAAGAEGQLFCPHCGHPNSPTVKMCESCHAAVAWYGAQASIDAEAEESGQSTFLRQLVEGCEQLQSEIISGPQFAGVLRAAYQRLQQAQKAQARLPALDAFGFQALGARQLLVSSLEQVSQALELLHEYLVEHKISTLSKAVRQLVAAGRQLEQVRDL